jgi:thiamine pyrophosphate-dependent acetolactate synthase large subunit-like protein
MRELFIYYRSQVRHAAAVEAAVRDMQSVLRARHPALEARWLRRIDDDSDRMTWMETYRAASPALHPQGVQAELQREIETLAARHVAPWIDGTRHVEVFDTCAS